MYDYMSQIVDRIKSNKGKLYLLIGVTIFLEFLQIHINTGVKDNYKPIICIILILSMFLSPILTRFFYNLFGRARVKLKDYYVDLLIYDSLFSTVIVFVNIIILISIPSPYYSRLTRDCIDFVFSLLSMWVYGSIFMRKFKGSVLATVIVVVLPEIISTVWEIFKLIKLA